MNAVGNFVLVIQ